MRTQSVGNTQHLGNAFAELFVRQFRPAGARSDHRSQLLHGGAVQLHRQQGVQRGGLQPIVRDLRLHPR
eukprot:6964677-Pyramimonas_sp.AAC.1